MYKFYTPKNLGHTTVSRDNLVEALLNNLIILATAFLYDSNTGILKLKLADHCIGLLNKQPGENDFTYQSLVGTTIPVRITNQLGVSEFQCERKSVLKEANNYLFQNIKPGMIVTNAHVASFIGYGAFIDLGSGAVGLLHINDMQNHPKHPSSNFKIGESITVAVKRIDICNKEVFLTQNIDVQIPLSQKITYATQKFMCGNMVRC